MSAQSPITALWVSDLSTTAYRALALAREGALAREFTRLGPVDGFVCRNADLLYRAPDDLLLLIISDESLSPHVLSDAFLGCRWIQRHADRVRSALASVMGGTAKTGEVNLRLRLVVPGFRDDLCHWSIAACCPTEIVQLGEAIDELGHAFVLRRTARVPMNGHSVVPSVAPLSGPAPTKKQLKGDRDPLRLEPLFYNLREMTALWRTMTDSAPTVMSTSAAVHVYGALVLLASRLLIATTPTAHRAGMRRAEGTNAEQTKLLREVLPILGDVAAYFASSAQDILNLKVPRRPWPKRSAAACGELAGKFGPRRRPRSSAEWSPIPPTFAEFLEEMVGPEIAGSRPSVRDETLREPGGVILEDAASSVSHAVYAAFGCDVAWGAPSYVWVTSFYDSILPSGGVSPEPGLKAVRADLSRIVCAHRLLIELGGLPDRSLGIAMLHDASKISQELASEVATADYPDMRRFFLYRSAQKSISALRAPGNVHRRGKEDSTVLRLCVAQEKAIRRFFEAVP